MAEDWALERETVLRVFHNLLVDVTGDGSKKRQTSAKPPWWRDSSHEAAIFSHLNKWKHGELRDKDSGTHPLVHLAWRALAIAYQELYGKVDPAQDNPRWAGGGSTQQEVPLSSEGSVLPLVARTGLLVDEAGILSEWKTFLSVSKTVSDPVDIPRVVDRR